MCSTCELTNVSAVGCVTLKLYRVLARKAMMASFQTHTGRVVCLLLQMRVFGNETKVQ